MTALDDAFAAFRAQVDTYGQTQYTQGKADQSLTDAAALASVQAQLEAADLELTDLQAEFDAYKLSHPDDTPPPPPPPPPAKVTIGMNFVHGTAQSQESQADAARIFVPAGQTDITTLSEFARAYKAGVRKYIFSWKDSTVPRWFATAPDDCTWYGVAHHEPEDMTASAWKALQASHMPAVRAAGGIPAAIFTNYSFSPKNASFRLADWVPPVGTHDVLGVDYYPDKSPNLTQAQCVANWKAAMKLWGVDRMIMGEYGVIGTASDAVADVKEIKALTQDLLEVECYWSQQASGKPDYHFTSATAAAWFA